MFRLPLQDGGRVYVLLNTDESQPARLLTLTDCQPSVTLTVARRRPALLWFDGRNALRAVEAKGDCRVSGDLVVANSTRGIVMALDGQDVRRSRALLLLPLQPGTVRWPSNGLWRDGVVVTGEIQDGAWRTCETAPLPATAGGMAVEVNPDQAVSLLLVCESSQTRRWTQTIARAMADPAALPRDLGATRP